VTITEPATLLTDYLMAALAIAFAVILGRRRAAALHARWWSLGFLCLAASALSGGTYHGFHESLPPSVADGLWRGTLVLGSLTSFAVMAAATVQWIAEARHKPWFALAALKLLIAVGVGLLRPDFVLVVVDFGLTCLFATVAGAVARERNPRSFRFLAAGVALFMSGALIQQARLSPHPAFNHNDLFHGVQMLGNVCFFVSARLGLSR